ISVAREESRDRRVEVERERIHDAIELRPATVVHRVGNEHDTLALLPLGEAEAPGPDTAPCDFGRLELCRWRVAEDVLGDDRDLIDEVEELFRRMPLEVRHCGERVAYRHRVDVRG